MPERIVVVGDALLDRDIDGCAERLLQDAPVPVVRVSTTRSRPGGAALAALLVARDGPDVTLVTALGDDEAAHEMTAMLHASGVAVIDLMAAGRTPQKVRVQVGGHPVVRLDYCDDTSEPIRAELAQAALAEASDGILVSDYGRGVAANTVIRRALCGRAARVPLVWDPHPRGPAPIQGATLVTPNCAEAAAAVGASVRTPLDASAAATRLCEHWAATGVAITLGREGAVLGMAGQLPLVTSAPFPVLGDACGAGDRFAGAAMTTLARGGLAADAVEQAVRSASRFLADGGVASLDAPEPRSEIDPVGAAGAPPRIVVATSGCFDLLHAGHIASLESARRLGDRLVVLLNSDASVRRLKGEGRPVVPAADRAAVLRALGCVDEVHVFEEDTPVRALERIRPAVFAKGADYGARELIEEAVMRQWGGRVVLVPYLAGRSTSGIVESARREA
jgi:D-beta-D-heptose 7-phosphate kinase / D-beta-D-heptose 1-phosphate adenosyltransferase